jgi:hypothetical protein
MTTDILLWDDDVKSAFRHVRYVTAIAAAFAFMFGLLLFIPLGCVFGSNATPSEWWILARARCMVATGLVTVFN